LGIAVFFGMIGVTVFGLLFTPSFYIISRMAGDRVSRWTHRKGARPESAPPAAPPAAPPSEPDA
jgi:HAE1 family hydrophobic/amphiphilic exporter-1